MKQEEKTKRTLESQLKLFKNPTSRKFYYENLWGLPHREKRMDKDSRNDVSGKTERRAKI